MTTIDIITEFNSVIDNDIEYTLNDMKKILTKIYNIKISKKKIINNHLSIDDIECFYLFNKRKDNDKYNNIREKILYNIWNNLVPEYFYDNIKWEKIQQQLNQYIKDIGSNYDYTRYVIEKDGGRNKNNDFSLLFYNNKDVIGIEKIEFKYNLKQIKNGSQFLSIKSDTFIKKDSMSYVDYFYDNYITEIAELINYPKSEIPLKIEYKKYIHSEKYDKMLFTKELKKKDIEIKKDKKKIVDKSIEKYLSIIQIDIDEINKILLSKHNNKQYLLYQNGIFYKDYISIKDINIITFEKIKNKNSLVFNSESKAKINMLLRWKNYAGILYPAWQISITK